MAALTSFGFGTLGLKEADFVTPDVVVQLGHPPLRIDLLTSIDGVNFDDAWPRRVILSIGGIDVPFIGRDDLIANQRVAEPPQDRADVARLHTP